MSLNKNEHRACGEVSLDGKTCNLALGHGGVCAQREVADNPDGTQCFRTRFVWSRGRRAVPHKASA